LVTRIVDGLSPTQKARFVFQELPLSFAQLDRLIVIDRNVTYADSLRTEPSTTFQVGHVEVQNTVSQGQQDYRPPERSDSVNRRVVCFYCNKPGHIQKNCFKRQAQLRGQERNRSNPPL
jgi:hypothetical protein